MKDIPIDQMDISRLRAELSSALTTNQLLLVMTQKHRHWGKDQIFHYCGKGIKPYSRLICSDCPPDAPVDGSTDFNAYDKIQELKSEVRTLQKAREREKYILRQKQKNAKRLDIQISALRDEKLVLLEENRSLRKANLSFAPKQLRVQAENRVLVERSQKLDALEAAGVDNWEGYDHAMDLLREEYGP